MEFSISVICDGIIFQNANCSGVERQHCSVEAAPGGYAMTTFLTVLIGPVVMLVMLFNIM